MHQQQTLEAIITNDAAEIQDRLSGPQYHQLPSSSNQLPINHIYIYTYIYIYFDGSNTDGSFTMAVSNSFLSPLEKIL